MKDALGHGSNGSGDGTLQEALRARLSHVTILKGGGVPQSSNKAAGDALSSALMKTQASATANRQTHNDQGHAWGSPEALADFKARYSPGGFKKGQAEIGRLRKQGK